MGEQRLGVKSPLLLVTAFTVYHAVMADQDLPMWCARLLFQMAHWELEMAFLIIEANHAYLPLSQTDWRVYEK
jgi:peptidyl-tRNA hydrolase